MRALKQIVGLLGVALLTSSVAHAQGDKIVLGYTGANDFLAAFVAKDKGFFEKRGLDVRLTRVANGSTIPPAMIGGSITVGGITPPLFMQADDNGLGLKILAAASLQSSKNPTASVVVRNGVNINSPADFVGKRVGAPGLNSVMHAMFVRWLRAKNVDPGKVTFVEAAFPQFADLLKAGQIDAALPVEPFRSRIEQANIGKVFANFFTDIRDNVLFSFYAVTGDWAAKNEKQAHAFRDALNEGLEYIRGNTEEAKKSQAAHLGLPPEVVSTLPLATYETKVEPQEVEFWVQLSLDLGIISKPLAVKDLIVP